MVRVLEELKRRGRKPEAIVIDNGGEFTSQVMDQWAYENQSAFPATSMLPDSSSSRDDASA